MIIIKKEEIETAFIEYEYIAYVSFPNSTIHPLLLATMDDNRLLISKMVQEYLKMNINNIRIIVYGKLSDEAKA